MANLAFPGVIARFKTDEPFENVLERTREAFKTVVQNLKGLRSATYYHIPETKDYAAMFSFATDADADNAVAAFKQNPANSHMEVIKADVADGFQLL